LVTGLNGEPVRSAQDLVSRVAALAPGDTVDLGGRHARQPFALKIQVIERPTHLAQQH
jgi:S1-C subfamily serine protease